MSDPNPISDAFNVNSTSLKQDEIDFLVKRHAVPNLALAFDCDGHLSVIGVANVGFEGKLFDFVEPGADGAEKALIVVARDCCGDPCDLVAWSPRRDLAAAHFGRVGLLGEHEVDAAGPLHVHRSVLSWLKAERAGVVIIDRGRAWRLLDGVTLVAEDVEHGLELRKALMPPRPRIVVAASAKQAAA